MITFQKVAFTGTQQGMTARQLLGVMGFLVFSEVHIIHHGDCIGADAQTHQICQLLKGVRAISIIIHPPENNAKRAWCKGYSLLHHPKPYLARNRDIVDDGEVLLATPKEDEETLRSGTWATIRYARHQAKPIVILWPDGRTEYENWPEES